MSHSPTFLNLYVPEHSDSLLSRWLVAPGKQISAGQRIAAFSAGKRLEFAQSPATGILRECVPAGTAIGHGRPICLIEVLPARPDHSQLKAANQLRDLVRRREKLEQKQQYRLQQKDKDGWLACQEQIDRVDQQIDTLRRQLLLVYRQIHSTNKNHKGFWLPKYIYDRQLANVPLQCIHPIDPTADYCVLTGPNTSEVPQQFGDFASCYSTSTYPFLSVNNERDGDPICDQYLVQMAADYRILVVADGCSWGLPPALAARKTVQTFGQLVRSRLDRLHDTHAIARTLITAMCKSHDAIMQVPRGQRIGTTTLLGGVLVRYVQPSAQSSAKPAQTTSAAPADSSEPSASSPSSCSTLPESDEVKPSKKQKKQKKSSSKSKSAHSPEQPQPQPQPQQASATSAEEAPSSGEWVFVFLTVGDCKAFLWRVKRGFVEELNPGGRRNPGDAADPGGRIGPYRNNKPDMRNLFVASVICDEGDILMLCTDGVHDNFDPELHGLEPPEVGFPFKEWRGAPLNEEVLHKTRYRARLLRETVGEPVSPQAISIRVIDYCMRTTEPSRKFMQERPYDKLPEDYRAYPGKMDHSMVVNVTVGQIPLEKYFECSEEVQQSRLEVVTKWPLKSTQSAPIKGVSAEDTISSTVSLSTADVVGDGQLAASKAADATAAAGENRNHSSEIRNVLELSKFVRQLVQISSRTLTEKHQVTVTEEVNELQKQIQLGSEQLNEQLATIEALSDHLQPLLQQCALLSKLTKEIFDLDKFDDDQLLSGLHSKLSSEHESYTRSTRVLIEQLTGFKQHFAGDFSLLSSECSKTEDWQYLRDLQQPPPSSELKQTKHKMPRQSTMMRLLSRKPKNEPTQVDTSDSDQSETKK